MHGITSIQKVLMEEQLKKLEILNMQIAQENKISYIGLIFINRVIPDALAYYRFLNLPEYIKLLEALHNACYKKIFILDCLSWAMDYDRTDDEAAQKYIHVLISEVHESLTFPVIYVLVLPPEGRLDFILYNI